MLLVVTDLVFDILMPEVISLVYIGVTTRYNQSPVQSVRSQVCAVCVADGYYTKVMSEVDSKVRAVVLNTNLYSTANKETEGVADPGGQLSWLEGVLQAARTNHDRVSIHST